MTALTQESEPPTTTSEEDRHSASQRWVNKTWELTQSFVAVSITLAKIYISVGPASLAGISNVSLDNAFFLIIGFYFGRTNHQRVGGVQTGR